MPGPPPPPPMAPPSMMPPPPTPFTPSKGGPDDRGALLKSIQKGTKLKKAVTNDKSAPMIGGSISNNNSNSSINNSPSGGSLSSSSAAPNGLNLGGLFAGGMPKLRATGKLGGGPSNFNSGGGSNNINNNDSQKKKPEIPVQPVKNMTSVQNELKKQMASDNRNRGPPPPAPVRNVSESEPESSKPLMKTTSANGLRPNNSSLHPNNGQPGQNSNTSLHRKAKSNVNLSSLDTTDAAAVNGFNSQPAKPVINYGKPNLAPKPPALNGKPATPPKKLVMNGKPVSRAHSMRSPRSPSPQSPDVNSAIKFGTVRNLSSVIGQSLGHSTGNLSPRPRPMLNGRPTAPPPSIPSQNAPLPPPHYGTSPQSPAPPPPSKTGIVRPPNHAPPPPPSALPQPPSHAPPPPPHRTHNTMRAPPVAPSNLNAPPPPPRHSSMRETTGNAVRKPTTYVDLDERYKHMFNPSSMFPRPPPYKHIIKLYSSKQAGSKQQAPQPPNLQSTSKTWNASSAC